MPEQIIHLHRAAPAKPAEGQACNGCGVCCMLETCPAARLRFLQKAGPCPALEWSSADSRYQCGLLTRPGHYLGWLPAAGEKLANRWFARWIAAGQGCDCSAEANEEAPSGEQGVPDRADGDPQAGTERGGFPD